MIEVLKEIAKRRKLENKIVEEYKSVFSSITNRQELFSLNCLLTPSKFSKYPETLIIKQMGGERNKRSDRNGDFNCDAYGNVEYKYSNFRGRGRCKEVASFLQIRPKHKIDNYIFDYYDGEKLYTFLLNKEEIGTEILYSHPTHGCKRGEDYKDEDMEVTLSLSEEKLKEWKEKYLIII